jgi:hypothetical protein
VTIPRAELVRFSRDLARVAANMGALPNGRSVPTPMLAHSSRSVMIWNSSSAPRGVDPDVAQLIKQEKVQTA